MASHGARGEPLATWRLLAHGVAALLMPPACAVCRTALLSERMAGPFAIVCGVCIARLKRLREPTCLRCGHPRMGAGVPLSPDGMDSGDAETTSPEAVPRCRWCARLPPYVRAVRSVCRMDEGTGAAMVHALKYGGWSAMAVPMALQMARLDFPPDVRAECTAVVPLPLSPVRERERGYNQAEQLAGALAQRWRIPIWRDVLRRTRHTRSQVRLTPSERVGNVSGAFATCGPTVERLSGAHIMLVDDVITTAASLNAAARALTEGGTRIISYITFGRAPDPGDRSAFDFDLDQD